MTRKNYFKLIQLSLFILVGLTLYFFGKPYLNLAFIQSKQDVFQSFFHTYPITTVFVYICLYVTLSLFGLPILTWFGLLAGYIFGGHLGFFIVIVSFSIHCFCGLLIIRYVARSFFEKKFAKLLMNINKKLVRQGWSYLLFLRVSLVVPSMVVNAACAITSFHIVPFTIISVVATIPVMTIIVYTGELLGSINSFSELYSFNNLLILLSLLFFAFIILIINHFKESQKNKDWM